MKTENRISRRRRIPGDILLLSVALLIADVAAVMPGRIGAVVLKADYREVFRYQLVLCAGLLAFALDVRFDLFTRWGSAAGRIAGRAVRTGVVLFTAVTLFFCGKVIGGGLISDAGPAEYALVLGLALENGEPAPDLLRRLDTAQAYLNENPEARLILTGGNPDRSSRTEAAAMRELLTRRGVPEDRLVLEDRARTTKENLANAAELISADEPVVVISSDYHMDRAVRTARGAGFSRVMRLPAPSGFFAYGANMTWEVIHDWNDLMIGLSRQVSASRP